MKTAKRSASQLKLLAKLRDKGLGLAPVVNRGSKASSKRPAARPATAAPVADLSRQGPITHAGGSKPADRHTRPGDVFEFVVEAPCEFLNANRDGGGHWAAKAKKVKAWRGAGYRAGVREQLPLGLGGVQVDAFVRKPIANRFDPANWAPTAKAVLDGLVSDYGLTEDDNRHFVTGPFMHDGGKGDNALIVRVTVLDMS
jgi:hypothetical protein